MIGKSETGKTKDVRWRIYALCAVVAVALFSHSEGGLTAGAEAPAGMQISAVDADVLPDGSLILTTGETLVFAGLDIGLGLAPASKAYLAVLRRLAEDHGPWHVRTAEKDRYGRLSGRIETATGEWVQEILLRLGLARFAGGLADPAAARALLQAERLARDDRRGIWRNPRFIIRRADRLGEIYDGFQIVEGRVRDVGRGDGVVFLNFGEDWRDDFTAGVTARLGTADFILDGMLPGDPPQNLFDLEGRTVRLRGVVRRYNGPYMEIAGPDQIELIGDDKGDPVRLRSEDPSGPRPASKSTL